jgi:AbrB family looped-hinge helix DNA binding protein
MLSTVRVQEKGQITIPREFRTKLKLKKGDLVTVAIQGNGVVIHSLDAAAKDLREALEKSLKGRGISLDALLTACQKKGGEQAALEYGLSEAEKSTLYMALQLQAQKALEDIRDQAEKAGLDKFTDQEIEAEIKAARDADSSSYRS